MIPKIAIIVGAGPAGLTAAQEFLRETDIKPVIFEMSRDIGGISRTVVYKGNRMDIGGHRFFSKSDRVMQWWQEVMPLQEELACDDATLGRKVPLAPKGTGADPGKTNLVLLIRNRLSRIFFLRSFFDYPISLKFDTFKNLGLWRIVKIGAAYLQIRLFPIRDEKSLEEFLINRFGKELYETFFKDYTEKVWGVPCREIPADWGAQRIRGLSITKTVQHAVKKLFTKDTSIQQKGTETSLIEQFLYPKLGPGQLWETVADRVVSQGAELHMGKKVTGVTLQAGRVTAVAVTDMQNGAVENFPCDYLVSTMPVKDLVAACTPEEVPQDVRDIAAGLVYRDFITVGLLLTELEIKNNTSSPSINNIVPDNWIYIQEKDVKIGRLQIFNNWSPYMVADRKNVWIGLEYFCNEGDKLWTMEDQAFIDFAIAELVRIDIVKKEKVLDATMIRVPKTYPAYFGTYKNFDTLKAFTDSVENLFLIGRNGMHRYNNADHSMLTAMVAVENIKKGVRDKDNIWAVNTEEEYHEQKSA